MIGILLLSLFLVPAALSNAVDHKGENWENRIDCSDDKSKFKVETKAEFFEKSLTEEYERKKSISYYKTFQKKFNQLKGSAGASGKKLGISASAQLAVDLVTDAIEAKESGGFQETERRTKYIPNIKQIQRKITTTVTLDGDVMAKLVEENFVFESTFSKTLPMIEKQKKLNELSRGYINSHFDNPLPGQTRGSGTIHIEESCVIDSSEPPCKTKNKKTNGTCRWWGCWDSRGPTNCINGECICKDHYYTKDGKNCVHCETL